MSKRRTEPEVIVFEEPKFKKLRRVAREKDVCRVSAGLSEYECMHVQTDPRGDPRGLVLYIVCRCGPAFLWQATDEQICDWQF